MSRAVLVGVAAWLAVVVVGSTAVWFVISSAGENVGAGEDAPARATATLTGRPTTTTDASSSPPTTSARPTPRRRTWLGLGGLVTAQCRGRDIGYVSSQPEPGFAVEEGDAGPVTLEVRFIGRDSESGRGSEVTAHCVDGVPHFDSRLDGGGGGGDE
ncbi:hypothetical protein GCM10027601_04180 [Nocardioides ungokensis]